MATYKLSIRNGLNESGSINVSSGEVVFVLGANGTGKSTLMYHFNIQNQSSLRIVAHRQSWINNSINDMSASGKVSTEGIVQSQLNSPESRYKDTLSERLGKIMVYDLIESENKRNRQIANAAQQGDQELVKTLIENKGVISKINSLLNSCGIPIEIEIGDNSTILAVKNGGDKFKIEQMSDGERNALIICANVLLAEENKLILLDEPEKHLHRSIISPLLSALLIERSDCSFVVSTHDIQLAADHSSAKCILLRAYTAGPQAFWDFDILENSEDIPDSIKQDILGSKRKILFVEGNNTSLDKGLYQLLYPEVSVVTKNSCTMVERAVDGVRGSEQYHHISAFGLIDSDDRTSSQVSDLEKKFIAALPFYSVEAIYYHPKILTLVADKFARIQGRVLGTEVDDAVEQIKQALISDKDRMCARLCEKSARIQMASKMPTHKDIEKGINVKLEVDVVKMLEDEKKKFDLLITTNIPEFLGRYPFRETKAIGMALSKIGLTRTQYESMVRKEVLENDSLKIYLRDNILRPLTLMLNS